jgi:hypothetical protein
VLSGAWQVLLVDGPGSRYPVRGRRVPVVVGGNSDGALARVAAFGDGWYGFSLPAAAVAGGSPVGGYSWNVAAPGKSKAPEAGGAPSGTKVARRHGNTS